MHELVTPAKVKIKYMKAIGKVHPAKVSYGDAMLVKVLIYFKF